MEIVSALMMASKWMRTWNNLLSTLIYGASPVLFIVFLIMFIVQVVKVKKQGVRKVKAIVYGCISGFFLEMTIGEIALMLILAAAISHM